MRTFWVLNAYRRRPFFSRCPALSAAPAGKRKHRDAAPAKGGQQKRQAVGGRGRGGTPMGDAFNLRARFVAKQKSVFARALAEIKAGSKDSHWMWYVAAMPVSFGQEDTDTVTDTGTTVCADLSLSLTDPLSLSLALALALRYVIPTPPFVLDGVERGSWQNREYALRDPPPHELEGFQVFSFCVPHAAGVSSGWGVVCDVSRRPRAPLTRRYRARALSLSHPRSHAPTHAPQAARAYLDFPEEDGVNLRRNLCEILEAIAAQLERGMSAMSLMGSLDEPKLRSAARLFECVSRPSAGGGEADVAVNAVCRRVLTAMREPLLPPLPVDHPVCRIEPPRCADCGDAAPLDQEGAEGADQQDAARGPLSDADGHTPEQEGREHEEYYGEEPPQEASTHAQTQRRVASKEERHAARSARRQARQESIVTVVADSIEGVTRAIGDLFGAGGGQGGGGGEPPAGVGRRSTR